MCDEYKEKDLLKTYHVNSDQLNINSLGYLVSLGKNEENQELIGIPNKQLLEFSKKKVIGPLHFLNHAPHIYFYRAKEDIAYTHKDAKCLFNGYNGYILQGDTLHYIGEKKKTIITKSAKSDLKDLFSEEEVLEFVSDDKLLILEQFIEEITKKKTDHICPANTALYTITTNSGKQKPVIEILNPLKIDENYLCYGNNPFKDKAIDLPLINKIESMPVLHKPEGAFPFSAIKVVEKRSIYEIKVNEVFTHLLESKNRTSLAESLNINSKDLCDFFREAVFNFYKINPEKILEVIRKDGDKLFTSIFKNRNGNTFEKIKNQTCIVLKDESIKTIHKAISELKNEDNPYEIAKTLNYSRGQVCKYIIKTGIFEKLKAIKLDMAEEELGDEYYMSLKDFINKNNITIPYNDSRKPNITLEESNNNSSILSKRKMPKKFDYSIELDPEFKSNVTKNIKQDSFESSKLKNNLLQSSSNVLSANSLFSLKKNVNENYPNQCIDEELNSLENINSLS